MLTPTNSDALLKRIDEELTKLKEPRVLIACGGGALIAMKVVERRTRDLDIISPEIDPLLKEIAVRLAQEFGLSSDWLNNGPASLARDLTSGWKKRTVSIFRGKNLELKALGREDLLATKLYAFCDREDDFEDVLKLKPTSEELNKILPWVLVRDASPLWPDRVKTCFERVKKRLSLE